MKDISKFEKQIEELHAALTSAKRVLITAPGTADGDSLGAQLAFQRMCQHRHPHLETVILNDEELPERYLFLPEVDTVLTPEKYSGSNEFDVGVIVDGGVDRSGRVRPIFEACKTTVFIDHHVVSCDFDYDIPIVEGAASATTELIYHISQSKHFKTPMDSQIGQHIYLGLIFDTGFFRHSNTSPESMELGAKLIRLGFDFTQVGERGMLQRSFSSLQLLAFTLAKAKLEMDGKIIWSTLNLDTLKTFCAAADDREGIIDHLFLTQGIEVACLFMELGPAETKVSFRSHGEVDVAQFARSVTVRGGGHRKAAGCLIDKPMKEAETYVLKELQTLLKKQGI